MNSMKSIVAIAIFALLATFSVVESQELSGSSAVVDSEEYKAYWNDGKAEITSYKLEQARYGELHEGYAVLVFVTEDFSKSKQVKLDNPQNANGDDVKVLKLNRIKKFDTGIYRYSMMDSVFTPIYFGDHPNTLKVTSSSQEWCGNTFTQLNLDDNGYEVRSFSYFESEGDTKFNLQQEILEDELWARIRLDPESLPVGRIKIIPATMASRLTHKELKVEIAEASLVENSKDSNLMDYKLVYDDSGRAMNITFSKKFPYEILSWEETYKSGFGNNAKTLTTKATKNKMLITDYWNKNKTVDHELRKKLGLPN
ncbi:MAG: hypothetical protein WD000_02565 [Thermodesulfobacteriota bacterium]